MNAKQPQGRQRGVILLEVLIAFSILAISVCVLNSVAASAFRNLRTATDQLRAAQLASDLLVDFSLSTGSSTARRRGTYQDRFRWVIAATPSSSSASPSPAPGTAVPARLQVDIEWGDTSTPHHYSVIAFRILRVGWPANGAS